MNKCQFCEKEAVEFGSHCSYAVCDSHIERGRSIEDRMWAEFSKAQEEMWQKELNSET